jgi:hypothetical protein
LPRETISSFPGGHAANQDDGRKKHLDIHKW